MKKLLILLAGLAMALTSCQRESEGRQEADSKTALARFGNIRINLAGIDEDTGTRSVVTTEVEGFKCAYLFAFRTDTGVCYTHDDGGTPRPVALKTLEKSFDWPLPVGESGGAEQRLDIRAVVNPPATLQKTLDAFLENASLTRSDLEALMYVCDDATTMIDMEENGMPMSGTMNNIYLKNEGDPLVFTLRRLYARYDVSIDAGWFQDHGWRVDAVAVEAARSNTEAPFFYSGSGIGYQQTSSLKMAKVDFATSAQLAGFNEFDADGKSTTPVTLYFLENCQGNIVKPGDGETPSFSWDEVHEQLGDAVDHCSYFRFVVNATKTGYGQRRFCFRVYPGQGAGMNRNFDIVRNHHRRISVRIVRPSDYFLFSHSGSLSVSPGHSIDIPYDTSLSTDDVREYPVSLDDSPITTCTVNDFKTLKKVRFTASADATEGNYTLSGGSADGEVRDQVDIYVTPPLETNTITVTSVDLFSNGKVYMVCNIEKDINEPIVAQFSTGPYILKVHIPPLEAGMKTPLQTSSTLLGQDYTTLCTRHSVNPPAGGFKTVNIVQQSVQQNQERAMEYDYIVLKAGSTLPLHLYGDPQETKESYYRMEMRRLTTGNASKDAVGYTFTITTVHYDTEIVEYYDSGSNYGSYEQDNDLEYIRFRNTETGTYYNVAPYAVDIPLTFAGYEYFAYHDHYYLGRRIFRCDVNYDGYSLEWRHASQSPSDPKFSTPMNFNNLELVGFKFHSSAGTTSPGKIWTSVNLHY